MFDKLRNFKFTASNLTAIVSMIFLVLALLFGYSYLTGRNLGRLLANQGPVVAIAKPSVPTFAFNIIGGFGEGAMNKPMAVVVSGKKIYVSDTNNQRIQIFDYDGKPLLQFGKAGSGKGEFSFPYGLAVDSRGQIYVADLYNGVVAIYDGAGRFVKNFAEEADGKKPFVRPAGLFLSGNNLYVTDVGLSQVLVFDANSERKLLEIGKKGVAPGQLNSPNFVMVNSGKVYVVDTGNDRVQVFDEQGRFLQTVNGSKDGKGETVFVNPRGIGMDGRGIIYVVSNINARVFGFNKDGDQVLAFGEIGADDKQFNLPNGLWVDEQGRIYITDTVNQRIAVYQN